MDGELSRDIRAKALAGNGWALDQLFAVYWPALRRWAHGRLPRWVHDHADTDNLLQKTLTQTLKQLPRFELSDDDALHACLRRTVLTRTGSELLLASGYRDRSDLEMMLIHASVSPLEAAIGPQRIERYEEALTRLSVSDREAIIGRVELGLSFNELAGALGKPSADAARVGVTRALVRLATLLGERETSANW